MHPLCLLANQNTSIQLARQPSRSKQKCYKIPLQGRRCYRETYFSLTSTPIRKPRKVGQIEPSQHVRVCSNYVENYGRNTLLLEHKHRIYDKFMEFYSSLMDEPIVNVTRKDSSSSSQTTNSTTSSILLKEAARTSAARDSTNSPCVSTSALICSCQTISQRR